MNQVAKKETNEKVALLKRTLGKDLTDNELELFSYVCKHSGLDPFLKQIYPVKRKNKGVDVMVIQVGIDGLRSIAERTGNYAPGKENTYTYDKEAKLVSATAFIKKRTADGTWHDVSATAYWNEYRPSIPSHFWDNMPHVMLGKCAEALAIRRAFPAQTAKLYTPEEMAQAEPVMKEEVVVESEVTQPIGDATTPLQKLREILETDGIDSTRLEEWIKSRAEAKGMKEEGVITSCLLPAFRDPFKMQYHKWCQETVA